MKTSFIRVIRSKFLIYKNLDTLFKKQDSVAHLQTSCPVVT